jgi:hypothetical protein
MKNFKIKEIGAITVIQPWAHVILHKGKNVENRQVNSHYRGTIAIHASGRKSNAWLKRCKIKLNPDDLAYGAVVGFAELTDVITQKTVTPKTEKWFDGKFGLVLINVIPLKRPMKTKRARGVWRLRGKILRDCLAELPKAYLKNIKEFKKQ